MILTRENILNFVITAGLILVPIYAVIVEEPFTITLATRAVIFSLAAVGLNIALGLGGMVSLGHAVFFGLGGFCNRLEMVDVIDCHDASEGISGQLFQESYCQLIVIFGEQLFELGRTSESLSVWQGP